MCSTPVITLLIIIIIIILIGIISGGFFFHHLNCFFCIFFPVQKVLIYLLFPCTVADSKLSFVFCLMWTLWFQHSGRVKHSALSCFIESTFANLSHWKVAETGCVLDCSQSTCGEKYNLTTLSQPLHAPGYTLYFAVEPFFFFCLRLKQVFEIPSFFSNSLRMSVILIFSRSPKKSNQLHLFNTRHHLALATFLICI